MRLFGCALCLDRCEKPVFTLPVLSPRQVFAFDHCFWSMDESNAPKYAGESRNADLQLSNKGSSTPVRRQGLADLSC